MIRNTNLAEYLPLIKEYREIKVIMASENPEFQKVADESEIIKNNQFIETCDKIGIRRFEKLLGIVPNSDDTWEARISRVSTRWNDLLPYTYRGLIQKLDNLCGKNNYQIILRNDEYIVELHVYLSLEGQVKELEHMLSYMLPFNMVFNVINAVVSESRVDNYFASTVVKTTILSVETDL